METLIELIEKQSLRLNDSEFLMTSRVEGRPPPGEEGAPALGKKSFAKESFQSPKSCKKSRSELMEHYTDMTDEKVDSCARMFLEAHSKMKEAKELMKKTLNDEEIHRLFQNNSELFGGNLERLDGGCSPLTVEQSPSKECSSEMNVESMIRGRQVSREESAALCAQPVPLPEIDFGLDRDNLSELIGHPSTSVVFKSTLEKLRKVSLRQFTHVSHRFLQIISYFKQLVYFIFAAFNDRQKGKESLKKRLNEFSEKHSKLK